MKYLYVGKHFIGYKFLEVEVVVVHDDVATIQFPPEFANMHLHDGIIGEHNRCWNVNLDEVQIVEDDYELRYTGPLYPEVHGKEIIILSDSRQRSRPTVNIMTDTGAIFWVAIEFIEVKE